MNKEKNNIIISALNGKRISSREAEQQYGIIGIFTTRHGLNYCELYSGSDKDPLVWANVDAERLAQDDKGNKLPHDITLSLPALHFNRADTTLELMSKRSRRIIMCTQTLMIHVVIFKSQEYKDVYDLAEACFIREY